MENAVKKVNIIKKLTTIALIVIGLQIPIIKLGELLYERQSNQKIAVEQIVQTSGPEQKITGPIIQIPYLVKLDEISPPVRAETYLFPNSLKIDARLSTENRYRGIFQIPNYNVDLNFSGTFAPAAIKSTEGSIVGILWNEAVLTIGISDPKRIQNQQSFQWNQENLDLESGSRAQTFINSGVHVNLSGLSGATNELQTFNAKLSVSGTQALWFDAVGKSTEVNLVGDWANPSFVGVFAPSQREVNERGFTSTWRVSDLVTGLSANSDKIAIADNKSKCTMASTDCKSSKIDFGVRLLNPIDNYRVVDRAIKYQLLIITLTFTTFFMFEIIYGLRLHPVQYSLVGLALVLFYLLLLSLSEHLGFLTAYLFASLGVISLIGGYALSVLNSRKRGFTIIAALSALYCYLFTALTSEDYALLSGSFGFTALLGIVMYCTRNIDWYDLTETKVSEQKVSGTL